jgi:hypothetical protein
MHFYNTLSFEMWPDHHKSYFRQVIFCFIEQQMWHSISAWSALSLPLSLHLTYHIHMSIWYIICNSILFLIKFLDFFPFLKKAGYAMNVYESPHFTCISAYWLKRNLVKYYNIAPHPKQYTLQIPTVITWWTCELCEHVEWDGGNTHTDKFYPDHGFTFT